VGKKQSLILDAYLGTCVAVALYDAESGIGGLIHILLPEPISPARPFGDEKYASTGFPIFLRALYDAGASPKNLKGCIAGGALVGPINNCDLELDIGGRTVERVMQFINDEKIQVERSETGGLFTCRLSVNMQTWECRIDPAGIDKLETDTKIGMPTPEQLHRVTRDLKPIPQVALKILRMVDDDLYQIDELTEEIRKDQVISAKTLKLCNSAVFSTRKKIQSIEHAVIMLGQKCLLKFVVSTSISTFFSQCGMGYSLCRGGIFHHAISTAVVAERLADLTGIIPPSIAYTAGLLHDIGKVALDQCVSAAFPLFYRQLNGGEENTMEIEKSLFGTDHTEVGGDIALNWSFPESLVEAIRHHHRPENSVRNTELVHIVYLADLVVSRFSACFELERINSEYLTSRMETIGLSRDEFPHVVDLIPVNLSASAA